MDTLKNLMAYNPSLLDYLGKGTQNYFDSVSQSLNAKVAAVQAKAQSADATTGGDQVTLSEAAQVIIADANETSGSNVTGVKKASQNFLMGFFDQSGLDLTQLSDEALDIIQGLQGVIAESTATQRDLSTDAAEEKYADGNKKVYTLAGDGTRLRVAIQYGDEGKPVKLSVTDITGGKVETADITLQSSDGKKTDRLVIERTQREYSSGHMLSLSQSDPINLDLYAKKQAPAATA